MKPVTFTACIVIWIIFFTGCKKEHSKFIDNSSIAGNWELQQISGSYTVKYGPGNGPVVKFTDTSYSTTDKFIIYRTNRKRGHYKIIADTSVNSCTGLIVPSGQFANRIILDSDTASEKIFYQISKNKLIILSGYFPLDGGVKRIYERQ